MGQPLYTCKCVHKYSSTSFCEIRCEESIKSIIFYNFNREYAYFLYKITIKVVPSIIMTYFQSNKSNVQPLNYPGIDHG